MFCLFVNFTPVRNKTKDFKFWLFSDKLLYGDIFVPEELGGIYRLNHAISLSHCKMGTIREGEVQDMERAFKVESPGKSFIVWGR